MNKFQEPWEVMSDRIDRLPIMSANSQNAIVHATFDDNDEPMVAVYGDQQDKYWRRIVACVNACQDISTDDLEDPSKEVVMVL